MLSNMTSWFAGIPPDDGQEEEVKVGSSVTSDSAGVSAPEAGKTDVTKADSSDIEQKEGDEGAQVGDQPQVVQIDLDEMAEKTLSAAKEWGSELWSIQMNSHYE